MERRLVANNIFSIAHRNIDGMVVMYLSLMFVNNIWVLAELKIPNKNTMVSVYIVRSGDCGVWSGDRGVWYGNRGVWSGDRGVW